MLAVPPILVNIMAAAQPIMVNIMEPLFAAGSFQFFVTVLVLS
jgi:hypothetical protein